MTGATLSRLPPTRPLARLCDGRHGPRPPTRWRPQRRSTCSAAAATRVDAAIAAVAVLGVVEPHMTGIGGDCFAILSDRDGKLTRPQRLPAARQRRQASTRFLDEGITEIGPDSVHAGHRAGAPSRPGRSCWRSMAHGPSPTRWRRPSPTPRTGSPSPRALAPTGPKKPRALPAMPVRQDTSSSTAKLPWSARCTACRPLPKPSGASPRRVRKAFMRARSPKRSSPPLPPAAAG